MSDPIIEKPQQLSKVILVALADLRDPDWNPREDYDEEEMQNLMDYIQAEGSRIPPITIWTPSPENAEDEPIGPPWAVISGKRRHEAYRRLGRNHIEAIPLDVPLQNAMFMALAANRDSKPFWLSEYIRVERLKLRYEKLKQVEIVAKTGWTKDRISRAVTLIQLLNPASRELIKQPRPKKVGSANFSEDENDQISGKSVKWRLPEKVALRLIPLWDENSPEASQTRAEQVIRKIIEHQLTGPQTDELVAHTLAGGDTAQFEPTAKERKSRTQKAGSPVHTHSPLPTELSEKTEPKPAQRREDAKVGESGETVNQHPSSSAKASEDRAPSHLPSKIVGEPDTKETVNQPQHTHSTKTATNAPQDSHTGSHTGEPARPNHESRSETPTDDKPSLFWQWMLGIKFISQLKSKVKKGEALTLSEKILVGTYRLYEWVLKPIGKHLGKFFKWAFKGVWHSLKKALGKVFGKTVEFVLPWLIVAAIVWGILAFFHFAVIAPWHWVENKIGSIFHHEDITPQMAPTAGSVSPSSSVIPTVLPKVRSSQLGSSKLRAETSNSNVETQAQVPAPKPTVVYQPAASFVPPASPSETLYDPKILELEIATIPKNSIVKDYPMTPDEGMPGDLAVSRMQDMTDPDKYTMMIGNSKQIITSINATATNLMVNYKSSDPFGGFLDRSGPLNAFWEDVKYIHINEIDTGAVNVFYQCSLVVSGAKYPLTIQCASAEDLEHLVSTLEYFIRSSRLAHDAQPAGLPYLDQGLVLNNDGIISAVWAGSPADKAGLKCGDIVWSLETNAPSRRPKADLEAQLRSLTPGTHTVYAITPQQWNKAMRDKNPSGRFDPKEERLSIRL